MVMEDNEKDIKKAVSWVLREITKKNPDKVAEFLTRWAKTNPNKDTRWIIKYGIKKLFFNENISYKNELEEMLARHYRNLFRMSREFHWR